MSGTVLPTLVPSTGAVTEDEALVITGNILASDTDNNGRTLSLVSVNGTAISGATTIVGVYGTLVIQANGSYTYTLNNTGLAVRALLNNQTLPDLFTYVATDGQSYTQTTSQTIQNLITQSEAFNTAPWVPFAFSGAVPVVTANVAPGPNGGASTADKVTLTTANRGLYYQTSVVGTYTFSVWVKLVSGSGALSLGFYTGSTGQVVQEAVLATGTWQQVSFTFTGDGNGTSNVSIAHSASQSVSGTFELWGAQLNSGATVEPYLPTTGSAATSTITTTAPAVLSSTLTIDVTGNTPVASPDSAAVVENGALVSSGNVLANDTDGAGKTLTVASVNGVAVSGTTTVVGTYGTLVIQANGQYTYTLSNAQANVQALAAGQVVSDLFSYVLSDGQTYLQTTTQTVQNLIVQSEAFNDPSWVPFVQSGAAPVVVANTDPGPFGGASTADQVTLTGASSGLYFQTAASGQYTLSVWVRLISGSGAFSFGQYSNSTGAVTTQAEVATSAWQRLSWTLTGDGNANSTVAIMHGPTQSATGVFEFWGAQLNPGAVAETYVPTTGSPASSSVSTTSNAVYGSTLTVSVTGATGSSPPIARPVTAAVTEDGATQQATGNLLANAVVFGGRTLTVVAVNGTPINGSTTITGAYGTLVIQPNGQYAYTLADAGAPVRALSNGQAASDVFNYTITDGLTSSQTVSQTSQNLITQSEVFGPSVWTLYSSTGVPNSSVVSNVGPGPTGSQTAADLALFGPNTGIYYTTAVSGQYTFSVWVRLISGNPNFSFNYYAGSSGATMVEAAVATSGWERLSWTFTGDGNAGSGVNLIHGVDQTGDTVLELWGAQLNSGATPGAYVQTTGSAINTTSTVTAPIGSTLTVAVAGDTPVAAPASASVTLGGTTVATGNLLANSTEANGLGLSVAAVNGVAVSGTTTITGTYGTLAVQSNGQYTYTLAGGQANVQALAAGQTVSDAFTYTLTDGLSYTQVTNQVAQNLIAQSEAFNAAPWTSYSPNGTVAITPNVAPGPMGGASTADQIVLTVPTEGIAYAAPEPGYNTFGVWAKLVSGNGAFTFNYFETRSGVTYAQTATATSAWQHFQFTFYGDGFSTSNLQLVLGANQAGGTFDFWGAQLNAGKTLNAYLPTTGTATTLSTPVTSPAPPTSQLTVSVGGSDAGKLGPALNFQASTQGVVADLATGQWSDTTTVLPLGDSITYGWGLQDGQNQSFTSEGYRGPLWSDFLAHNTAINLVGDQSDGPPTLLEPLNGGYPGQRTDQIAQELPGLLATQHPNDILLLAGINDLSEGFTPAFVASNIAGMLATVAGTSPTTEVYVAQITPVVSTVVTASTIATANSDIASAVSAAAASGDKVSLVNTSNVTTADISTDGVHPNPTGYSLLAQDWYSAITANQPFVGGTPGGSATAISPAVVNLVGGGGNNLLIGDTRPNFITAGPGNDILIGGGGNDTLVGGTGQDDFVIVPVAGQVSILNFNPAQGDYLDWDNIPGVTSTANLTAHTNQVGGGTVVDLSSFVPNLKVTLANYTGTLSHSLFGPPAG